MQDLYPMMLMALIISSLMGLKAESMQNRVSMVCTSSLTSCSVAQILLTGLAVVVSQITKDLVEQVRELSKKNHLVVDPVVCTLEIKQQKGAISREKSEG